MLRRFQKGRKRQKEKGGERFLAFFEGKKRAEKRQKFIGNYRLLYHFLDFSVLQKGLFLGVSGCLLKVWMVNFLTII